MRSLTFTLYPHKRSSHGEPRTESWEWWATNAFATHEQRGDPSLVNADKKTLDAAKDGGAVVLGKITEGHPHAAEEVLEVNALALDLDGVTEEQAEAALTTLAPFAYVVYTTFKHGAALAQGKPRLRVFVPLREPVAPADYLDVWLRFTAFTGGVNDISTKDISRLHFLPASFDVARAWSLRHEGKFLSALELPVIREAPPRPLAAATAHGTDPLDEEETLQRLRHRIACANKQALGEDLARWLQLLRIGDSLADRGKRHEALERIAWWISAKDSTLPLPVLETLFEKSIDVMQSEDPSWDGYGELQKLWESAVKKRNTQTAQKAGVAAGAAYTQEELDYIAAAQGCTAAELKKRWVVQIGDAYFFLQGNGYYSLPARGRDAGRTTAVQELARAPVTVNEVGPKGVRKRTIGDIVEAHGYCASRMMVDLTAPGTWLDMASGTLHEAPAPVRIMTPVYDPEIAEWLKILGGDQHEDLLDWLAVFPDLDIINVGLYVKGVPSAGKSLLCTGLARFWTEGIYTPLEEVFRDFNDGLQNCPLVVGDEQVPSSKNNDPTGVIRRLVGNRKHELKRKYRTPATLLGALRLVLTANNADMLRALQTTREDYAAIISRFMVIDAKQEAANYLTSLGGAKYLDKKWIQDDGIVKHVTYLAMTRAVSGRDRFANKIQETEGHRQAFTSKWGQQVAEWLVNFCANPAPLDAQPDMKNLVRVGEGEFLINSRAVCQCWQVYLPSTRTEPNPKSIGHALAVMSVSEGTVGGRVQRTMPNGARMNFYKIDTRHLHEFARDTGYGEEDSILRMLNRKHRAENPPKVSNGS